MSLKHRVGARIRAIRKQRRLTQPQLAEMIDRSPDAVGNLERGASLPSFETLERLAKALGVPVKEFFDFGDEKETGDLKRAELLASISQVCRGLETQELELAARLVGAITKA